MPNHLSSRPDMPMAPSSNWHLSNCHCIAVLHFAAISSRSGAALVMAANSVRYSTVPITLNPQERSQERAPEKCSIPSAMVGAMTHEPSADDQHPL